ncbi:MAG: phosphoribosylanthranilate isomerase [Armatimonadetes bacterium]|nr:phosphoribosylanthranilate isomerase [Armatimonadota bacterium]
MRTRIKVCGITRPGDAIGAVADGVDALGFIFAESPRRITPEQAGAIITRAVPPLVSTVGVFVDEAPEAVAVAARTAGLTAVQLHGAEPPEYLGRLRSLCPARIIKAFRIRSREDAIAVHVYRECADAFLLDTFVSGAAGGTGQTFDWELALTARAFEVPLILAGGLNPENVAEAVRRVRPYAVDVSSGVEVSPGVKDAEKVRAFVAAVREADCGVISERG